MSPKYLVEKFKRAPLLDVMAVLSFLGCTVWHYGSEPANSCQFCGVLYYTSIFHDSRAPRFSRHSHVTKGKTYAMVNCYILYEKEV